MKADYADLSLRDQVSMAIGFLRSGQHALAAAAVGALRRPHTNASPAELDDFVACALIEIQAGRARGAEAALEAIATVFCPPPPLRVIVGGRSRCQLARSRPQAD